MLCVKHTRLFRQRASGDSRKHTHRGFSSFRCDVLLQFGFLKVKCVELNLGSGCELASFCSAHFVLLGSGTFLKNWTVGTARAFSFLDPLSAPAAVLHKCGGRGTRLLQIIVPSVQQ